MSLILDLLLVAIALFSGWRGFKTGIINGICGILAVLVSIYGANIVATAYSSEFTGALRPFAVGLVDSITSDIEDYARGTNDDDFEPVLALSTDEVSDPKLLSKSLFRQLGLIDSVADTMADEVALRVAETEENVSDTITEIFIDRLCYIALFSIAFILLIILFTVVGNVLDLSFGIPGLENFNHIVGALLGLAQGVLLILALTCVLRYFGIVLSDSVLDKTNILAWFIENNKIASLLGV